MGLMLAGLGKVAGMASTVAVVERGFAYAAHTAMLVVEIVVPVAGAAWPNYEHQGRLCFALP